MIMCAVLAIVIAFVLFSGFLMLASRACCAAVDAVAELYDEWRELRRDAAGAEWLAKDAKKTERRGPWR